MQKQVTNDRVHPQGPSDRTSGSHRTDSECVEVQFVEEHVNVLSDSNQSRMSEHHRTATTRRQRSQLRLPQDRIQQQWRWIRPEQADHPEASQDLSE